MKDVPCSRLTRRHRLLRPLRHWVVTAPSGTVRHDLCLAVEVSRLAAGLPAQLKIFAASLLARAHDAVPGIRRLGTWFTIRYRGGRYRFYVARHSDIWVLLEVLGWGAYDQPGIPEPRTILDLGSHIGTSLLHFRATYPNARIVGVEPNPETLQASVQERSAAGGGSPSDGHCPDGWTDRLLSPVERACRVNPPSRKRRPTNSCGRQNTRHVEARTWAFNSRPTEGGH
jgi:hypothetical protein